MCAVSTIQTDRLAALQETRDRTLSLVSTLGADQLTRVVTPLLSPLVWDLGHIANFEQRWLLGESAAADDELAVLFDPFRQPRAVRGDLPLPGPEQSFEYMAAVRERVLASEDELDDFKLELVIQHEQQHNETMLQLMRMIDDYEPPADLRRDDMQLIQPSAAAVARGGERWIEYPSGEYRIGRPRPGGGGFAYDNESGEHSHYLAAFEIGRRPVSAGEYREWVDAGHAKPPMGWLRDGSEWLITGFGDPRPLDESAPVIHVSWYEADAYARAHSARLPTEFEWEVAASYDPATGADGLRSAYEWGDRRWTPFDANLDQLAFGPRPAGRSEGRPADMLGQVWEWTSSEFQAYPGFRPFAYERYSAPFFAAGYRVLRGGSWATRPRCVNNLFRNWDLPERRQIFSGFRLARDVLFEEPE